MQLSTERGDVEMRWTYYQANAAEWAISLGGVSFTGNRVNFIHGRPAKDNIYFKRGERSALGRKITAVRKD